MQFKMDLNAEKFSPEQIMNIYEKAVEKAGNEYIFIFVCIRLNYLHKKDKALNRYSYLFKALDNNYVHAISQISLDYYIKHSNY